MRRVFVWFATPIAMLCGCATDVADQSRFACDVHADCASGFFCAPPGVCTAGPVPADMTVSDAQRDQRIADSALSDAHVIDAAPPPDARPVDAAPPPDARPVDAAPPPDARPIDAAPPLDAQPVDAAPPPDARPVDAAPPPDAQPVDAAPPPDARPVDAAPPPDRDGDGIPDAADNCPDMPNPDQANHDEDDLGDVCDPDDDDDGVLDDDDNCPLTANAGQENADAQPPGDACQDLDQDGWIDLEDNCPVYVNPAQRDRNTNGIGDACEVPCLRAGELCAISKAVCEVEDACGGTIGMFEYAGICNGFFCADFADESRLVGARDCPLREECVVVANEADCVPADRCVADSDGDGVPDVRDNCPDLPNAPQRDRNRNGVGDVCEVPCANDGDECILNATICGDDICGASWGTLQYVGRCISRLCADFAFDPTVIERGNCAAAEICQTDNLQPCTLSPRCPDAQGCTPEMEGANCFVDGAFDRPARCVDGACRAWDCLDPVCNEFGPRRFNLDDDVRVRPDGSLEQPENNRSWVIPALAPPDRPRTVMQAHAVCANINDGANWRLPTMYELHSLAARNEEQRLLLRGPPLELVPDFFVSRTIVGPRRVAAVSLVDGSGQLVVRNAANGFWVACVQEHDVGGQDQWDLSFRRNGFDGGANAVFDSLTELIWFIPDSPPVRQPQAQQICEMMGGVVPSVEALSSLLTFNSRLRLPAPGYWLDYDGAVFGNADYSVWAGDEAPLGVAWRVDLSIGRVHPVNDNQLHRVVCLAVDDAPEDPEPDAPEPDAPEPSDAAVPDQGVGAVDFGMQ